MGMIQWVSSRNDAQSAMGTVTIAIAIAGLLFGPYIGLLTYRNYKLQRKIEVTETTPTRNVRPGTTVEVQGEITTAADTVDPLLPTDDDAVCCVWRVDTWDETGDTSTWNPSAIGAVAVPFTIADEYGEQGITVGEHHHDLGSAGVSLQAFRGFAKTVSTAQDMVRTGFVGDEVVVDMREWDEVLEVGPDEAPPETVAAFIEQTEAVGEASGSITNVVDIGRKHGRRRYRQATLAAGDEVYALGATDGDGVLRPGADERLIVGRGTEADLLGTITSRVRRGTAVATVAVLAGLMAAYFAI